MLNSSKVLTYIKNNLAFPFQHLEWEDDQILEYIQEYTIKEWSHYFPDVRYLGLNLLLDANKVPGRSNEWYIEDPEGIEILTVVDIYFPNSNLMALGYPPLGAFTQGDLRHWALDVNTAMMVKQYSDWNFTHEFRHPNIVRISPLPAATTNFNYVTVEYERMQPSDFRGIRNDLEHFFLELALADIMIVIGRIRKRYGDGNLRTPFGEIPLSAEIFDEGKEKRSEVIEKLTNGSLPNIVVDFG